jgi:choline monooxygenase
MESYSVDPDIRRASTLPASFYKSPTVFEELEEKVFARSWQWLGHERQVELPGQVHPLSLLEGFLDEPLLLTRDGRGAVHCLSNVCTHRGNLLIQHPESCRELRCRYHGRRFSLDGRLRSMPEFRDVENFPSPSDDLASLTLGSLGGFLFGGVSPPCAFEELLGGLRARIADLPLAEFRHEPTRSREYLVQAHWALYVDNYLEGFHIPYIHPELARTIESDGYTHELWPWSSLQIAHARGGQPAFTPRADERPVAAYYFWLYPNTMLNFYPWGLSVNVVQPQTLERTKVVYHTYVWRPELLDQGAGGNLDRVEREDETVVEQVQRGIRSRFYRGGRYSPAREAAVHHFHRLLKGALEAG